MRVLATLLISICTLALVTPVHADTLPYDTVILNNGHKLYGDADAHPVFTKSHTIVRFSNGGSQTLKNTEIEAILPNSAAQDQFERWGS